MKRINACNVISFFLSFSVFFLKKTFALFFFCFSLYKYMILKYFVVLFIKVGEEWPAVGPRNHHIQRIIDLSHQP